MREKAVYKGSLGLEGATVQSKVEKPLPGLLGPFGTRTCQPEK